MGFDFDADILTWALTLISSIIGGISVIILTYVFNNIGRIKVILTNVEKKYYKEKSSLETIEVLPPPYSYEYDFFTCTFTIGLYNESLQTKVIKNIEYGLRDWATITKEQIINKPVNLLPKECYTIEFTVKYKRDYQNYFKYKKHYICFRNARGWRFNKRLSQFKSYAALNNEIKEPKNIEKKFSIVSANK